MGEEEQELSRRPWWVREDRELSVEAHARQTGRGEQKIGRYLRTITISAQKVWGRVVTGQSTWVTGGSVPEQGHAGPEGGSPPRATYPRPSARLRHLIVVILNTADEDTYVVHGCSPGDDHTGSAPMIAAPRVTAPSGAIPALLRAQPGHCLRPEQSLSPRPPRPAHHPG